MANVLRQKNLNYCLILNGYQDVLINRKPTPSWEGNI